MLHWLRKQESLANAKVNAR